LGSLGTGSPFGSNPFQLMGLLPIRPMSDSSNTTTTMERAALAN
jgi:hypothetical protein